VSPPALVAQALRGRLLYDAAPASVTGLSGMGGTHRLYFGDGPDLVLYDSGGVFGSARAWPVELDDQGCPSLWARWADQGQALIGEGRFGGTRRAAFVLDGPAAQAVSDSLTTWLVPQPGQALRGGLPLGVRCDFVAARAVLAQELSSRSEAAAAAVKALVTPFDQPRSARQAVSALGTAAQGLPPADAALLEHLACGEVFVRVQVVDGRLLLSRDAPGDVADIPCAQLVFTEQELVGSVMVAGFEVEGLQIPVPPQALPALQAHFGGTTAAIPRGTTDQVDLHDGSGTGSRRVDLVLTRERISLRERDGSLIHAFELEQSGIQGTSTDFLVVDAQAGPLRIRPCSTRFQERILSHRAVAQAAERTSREGPFLGVGPDEAPISVHPGSQGLTARGAPLPDATDVQYELIDDRPWLVVGDWRFSAPSEVLEAVANHLAARAASDLDPALQALPRLEADWLLHAALGPLVLGHRSLVEVLGEPLRPPDDADERLLVLTRLSEQVPFMRRAVQTARVQLPTRVRRDDARLAVATGVSMPTVRWRLELMRDIEVQLDRIEAQLAQLDWLSKALTATTPGYGRLAAQLGMSIINPLRLVGTGAEAVRIAAIKRMVASAEAEGSEQVALTCVQEWSHLVGVLAPMAALELLSGFEPARRELADRLARAERTPALRDGVARRVARLQNHARFPPSAGEPPRARAIEVLRQWMQVELG